MSASSTSPPTTPLEPATPTFANPAVRVTLPTPPSFSHRRRSCSTSLTPSSRSQVPEEEGDSEEGSNASDSPEKAVIEEVQWKKSHGRSVSFNIPAMLSPISPTDTSRNAAPSAPSPGVYRIPQRSPDYVPASPSPLSTSPTIETTDNKRRTPPRPLSLSPASQRFVGPGTGISPTTRLGPMTAPAPGMSASSRWSSTAAARGLSIAPALAKQRHSTSSASGPSAIHSIWSANLGGLGAMSGWISPALASARSVGSAARTRGLTVAVLKGNEVLLETLPTPGLGRSTPAPTPDAIKEEEEMEMLKDELASPDPAAAGGSPSLGSAGSETKRPREIILCRYYHTPDLTCTSRPCRFVHDLATAGLHNASITDYNMRSPTTANLPSARLHNGSPDFTSGTFAAFQAEAHKKTLSVKDVDEKGIVPGETVVVASENGTEVEGVVFLMSGGGKGPSGRGKAKFKTELCKHFAEGNCVYGVHCSFIHDEKFPEPPKTAVPDFKLAADNAKADRRRSFDASTLLKGPAKSPWRAIPATVKVPSVAVKLQALDRQQEHLSAFAAPFLENPVEVGKAGELIPATQGLQARSAQSLIPTPAPLSAKPTGAWTKLDRPPSITRSKSSDSAEVDKKMRSAWSKGPPANLKTVTIDSTPIVHQSLMVPVSALSMFGTESDPATPWDPAIRADKLAEARATAEAEAKGETDADADEGEESRNPEYPPTASYATVVPDSDYDYSSYHPEGGMPYPYSAPTYPWGMPMSPVVMTAQGTLEPSVQSIPGGLGVMWTPTGWAVQDAAMKMALFQAENGWQSRGNGRSEYVPKTYWRTKKCKFYEAGKCPHGDSCTYIHEDVNGARHSRRTPYESVKSTKSQLRKPRPIHPCKFYNSSEGCTNGESCAYLHTFVVPSQFHLVEKPRPWRTQPCRHFQVNRCQLGDACHFAHVYDGTGHVDEEEESSDEDDVQIVTEDTSIATISPPRSVQA